MDNKPAKPSPASRLPFRGKLEFDYVSWRSIRPGEPGGSPLSKNAFDYMMKELASKTSTAAAPGEMHFVDLVLQAQAGKYHGPKEEAGEVRRASVPPRGITQHPDVAPVFS